jgi:nicotinate-nucleotide adenylyltransferase
LVNKRIGIFGGTFDPPHLGHLILAEEIRERVGLDEVVFVPCNEPPHKERPHLTEASHRYAMVVAATLQNPAFVPSPIEVNRPGPSYSIDTVRELSEGLGETAEIYFVAGLDSFLEIESWKDWEDLLELCHFVVVSRPGSELEELRVHLPERIGERVVDICGGPDTEEPGRQDESPATAGAAEEGTRGRTRVHVCDAVHLELSSTDIRRRVLDGRSIRYRVPAEVERYIRIHGLYTGESDTEEERP